MHRADSSRQLEDYVLFYLMIQNRVVDLDRQLILTKDNITVNIDTCVYYRIVDAKLAYYSV
jgi:regulator of protease activity HflC (stomatin/prohibitin superfamily)